MSKHRIDILSAMIGVSLAAVFVLYEVRSSAQRESDNTQLNAESFVEELSVAAPSATERSEFEAGVVSGPGDGIEPIQELPDLDQAVVDYEFASTERQRLEGEIEQVEMRMQELAIYYEDRAEQTDDLDTLVTQHAGAVEALISEVEALDAALMLAEDAEFEAASRLDAHEE